MHAYIKSMRTTIEISNNVHLRLLEEAALTGQRGFSSIVEKAIQQIRNSLVILQTLIWLNGRKLFFNIVPAAYNGTIFISP